MGNGPAKYILISRWREFQHYKPNRDRGPAWIKDYTAQLNDARYWQLTDRQRALLRDLRDVFAMTRACLPHDAAMVARARHSQTRHSDLKALNRAGFIEVISRATLEQRLEELYNNSTLEVDKERDKEKAFKGLGKIA